MLHSIRQQIWKTQQCPQDWKRSVFIPIPKKGNAKECSNYRTIALISHASKVMLKILQARLQQYVNWELSDFWKTMEQVIKLPTSVWIEKAREFQKNICFCFIDYGKAFDCVDHNKLWKTLEEMGIPDHLTCLLRNLYAGQEATVRTRHGTMDWFHAGKDWRQEEKGMTEDVMVGWLCWLNEHGFGWTLGVGDGRGSLAWCSSWVHKELDTTEQLNYLPI